MHARGARLDGGVVVPEHVVEDEGEDLVGVAHHVEGRRRHVLQHLLPGVGMCAHSPLSVAREGAGDGKLEQGAGTASRFNGAR